MKKQIQLTTILITLCLVASAQNFSEVTQTNYSFTSGEKPALQILFDEVSKINVKDAAKEVFKNYNSKLSAVKESDEEFLITDFTLEENQKLSKGKMKISEKNGNIILYAFFKTNESNISEQLTPNEILHYKNLIQNIARKAVVIEYDALIKEQEKNIKNENKKLKSLLKDEDNEHKSIGKNKIDIDNSKQEIERLKTSITNIELSIIDNNDQLKAKKSEIAEKNIKSLNSKISDIIKENKSLHKSIDKHFENIAEIKAEIAILNSSLKGNETEKINLKSSENIDKYTRKRLKKLNKEGLKTLGEIEENKILVANKENKISNLENDITTNQSKIDQLHTEIAEHNEDALQKQLKLIEKEAKSLSQEKRSLEKKMKKTYESINTNNQKIRESEENIKELKSSQEKQIKKVKESNKKLKKTEGIKITFE